MFCPNVVLLCSCSIRSKYITDLLQHAGVTDVNIISSCETAVGPVLPLDNARLVICDSLQTSDQIAAFGSLCKQDTDLWILESQAMCASATWAVKSFCARGKKMHLGHYSEMPTQAQIFNAVEVSASHQRRAGSVETGQNDTGNSTHVVKQQKHEMCAALQAREIIPYFQPKYCLKSERVVGVEVLARWQHPEKGLFFPGYFLPMINEYGLHQALFDCVLEQAMNVQTMLLRMGHPLVFSYNIEAPQLHVEGFAAALLKTLIAGGVPLSKVTLEVTEGQMLDLHMTSISNIFELISRGVTLSLDDFGTGFSSIQRLAQLPFKQIKLDSAFVAGAFDSKSRAIIEFAAKLAHSLDMEIVAEGVETQEQLTEVKCLGICAVQGNFFYPPLPSASLIALSAGELILG